MAKGKKEGKGGKPSKYSDKLAAVICERISGGESVTQICRDEKMPHHRTVYSWLLDSGKKEFLKNYNVAQKLRADVIHDEIFDIADDGTNDWMKIEVGIKKRRTITVPNHEHINRSRLRVDTRKWVLARMNPKKYGEHMDVTTKGKALPATSRPVVVNYYAPKKPVTK